MNLQRLNTGQRISAVAILVTVIAAFLPWVSLFAMSARGIEGDGVISLVLALVGAALLALITGLIGEPRTHKGLRIALLVLAALTALVGLFDMNGAAAIGLYLTLFAGVAWTVGAAMDLGSGTPTPAAPSDQA